MRVLKKEDSVSLSSNDDDGLGDLQGRSTRMRESILIR